MMAWPRGTRGAPKIPWPMRYARSGTRLSAVAHRSELTANSMTLQRMTLRWPKRATSHPVIGVATAVAMTLRVTTQETCSEVAESAPWSCGRITLTMVTVSA